MASLGAMTSADAGARTRPEGATDTVGRDDALDGVRAIAVVLVVLTHAAFMTGFTSTGGFLGRLAGRGDFGVYLFFALSGYLLHARFLRAAARGIRLSLTGYAWRRAARVLPAYWAALLVVVLAERPSSRISLLHAAGLQIYTSDRSIPSFSQAWSVATELSFYAALPVLALILEVLRARSPRAPIAALAVLSLAALAGLLASQAVEVGRDVLPERLLTGVAPVFLVGMALAEAGVHPTTRWAERWRARAADPWQCWALSAGCYVLATTPITGSLLLAPSQGPQLSVRVALGAATAGAFLLPVVLGPVSMPRGLLGSRLPRWLGRISYGVFLWHLPVFSAIFAVTSLPPFRGGLIPLLALGIPVTLALAEISHRLIEQPLIDWAGGRNRSAQAEPATSPAG